MIMGKRILIISSDPELLRILQHNLPAQSYEVSSSRDRGELEELLDRVLPDLVILDILMPWLDGIELCLCIRQWCQVPIIMLSTWGARRDTVRSLDLNSNSYLTEPFGVAELMALIEGTICRN